MTRSDDCERYSNIDAKYLIDYAEETEDTRYTKQVRRDDKKKKQANAYKNSKKDNADRKCKK